MMQNKFFSDSEGGLPISKIQRYIKNLANVQQFIEDNKDNLNTEETGEAFKKKLLDLIVQTTSILEEYY